jgi:hypothetical protein
MLGPAEQHEADRIAARYEKRVMSSYIKKETKTDRAFHDDTRDLWVYLCDAATRLFKRLDRLVHPAAVNGRRKC